MKRVGNLIESIADYHNLVLAYYKASKGKQFKKEVQQFAAQFEENMRSLHESLLSDCMEVGGYHTFFVYDPKERLICVAPFYQRVLHHALMNICHPYFDNYQIEDSFASRIGKGTYAALDKAMVYNKQYAWCLKLDVRHYFDSIDHHILYSLLERRFKDSQLLTAFKNIIDSYWVEEKHGLPIGNLSSQYFANHYLALADHWVKEQLHVRAYVRYMDDILVWDNNREALLVLGRQIRMYLSEQLHLQLKIFQLYPTCRGCEFLGYHLSSWGRVLSKKSKKRFRLRMHLYYDNYNSGYWDEGVLQQHLLPLVAFTQKANSIQFRRHVMLSL